METLMSQREVALALRLSERTLERLRVSGLGPRFLRCGGRAVRYRQSDIDAWIAKRVVASTSQAVAVGAAQ
jgi:predicted DNA-binding transcriptional regulator AlpA